MKELYEIKSLMSKLSGGILTEALLMEATRDEIYTQYYDEHNGKVKKIPRNIFDEICNIGDVDGNPQKMSEFAKWLCDGYRQVGFEKFIYDKKIGYIFARGSSLKKDFITFRKVQKIKPEGVDLNLRNYNIETFMEKMEYVREHNLDFSQKDIKKLGSDTVYQDNTWKVVLIKSRDASLFYGRGTTWCTSSTESSMYFDDYMKRGLLFIFINTTNNTKYQGFYSFDFEWDEFKDPQNRTIYTEDIFPEEMFKNVTESARVLLEKRLETVWENEAEISDELDINDTFKVFKVERLERYRVKNVKTGEFLTLPKANTFTGVYFNEKYNILFLEINYGHLWGVVYINGDVLEIIEPNIRAYSTTSIEVYDTNHRFVDVEEKEFFIFRYGDVKYKIFDAEQHLFVKINGKEEFKSAYSTGGVICIEMFIGKFVMFSLKKKTPIVINGDIYIDKLSYKGGNLLAVLTPRGNYLYNTIFNSFIPISNENSVNYERGFIAINVGDDQNKRFKIYKWESNKFLKTENIDVFDDYHQPLYGILLLHNNTETSKAWVYNFNTESFCDSNDVPNYDTDIEIYYNNTMLFWNNSDILMGYDISENKVFQLPVTIDYESVKNSSKRKQTMLRKSESMAMLFNDDNSENITLINLKGENRTIIYRPKKEEKPKLYTF